ncbi:MAG: hypothetical protein MHMPM18_003656 [Marteilia pararefringens]
MSAASDLNATFKLADSTVVGSLAVTPGKDQSELTLTIADSAYSQFPATDNIIRLRFEGYYGGEKMNAMPSLAIDKNLNQSGIAKKFSVATDSLTTNDPFGVDVPQVPTLKDAVAVLFYNGPSGLVEIGSTLTSVKK